MAKKLLATALAAVMIFTALLLPASAAVMIGDVDKDGRISSADARLALRGSVGLENVTGDFAARADADKNGKVESADARLILRTSVSLDAITQDDHEHNVEKWKPVQLKNGSYALYHQGVCTVCGRTVFGDHDMEVEVITPSTCTEDGSGTEKCVLCGLEGGPVEIPAAHEWALKEEIPATCTENGSRELHCAVCGKEITEIIPAGHTPGAEATCTSAQVCTVCGETLAPALGHVYAEGAAITATKGIRCERCGKIGLPSFNELVNVLKDGTHSYTGFKLTKASASEPKLTGIMETLINLMISMKQITKEEVSQMLSESIANETYYSALVKNRSITDYNFNLLGENVVSALKDSDPQSLTTEYVKGVDFLASLPDTYVNERGHEDDLTAIKNTTIGDVIKVTVTLAPERYSEVLANGGDSPISRIDSEIPESLESFMAGSQGDLGLGGTEDGDDLGSILNNAIKLDLDSLSDITVTYYFDALTNAPIAAVYDGNMLINFVMNLYITDDLEPSDTSTGSIIVDSATELLSYYFFDDYFNA